MSILNRVKVSTATTGNGPVTLGASVVPQQTFTQAGAVNGGIYSLLIEDGTAWEISYGAYSTTGPTITRVLRESSTGALLNLSGSATVSVAIGRLDVIQTIEKRVFAGGETSISFANIPQDFSSLEMEVFARFQGGTGSTGLSWTVNGLATAIYDRQWAHTLSSSATGSQILGASTGIEAMQFPNANFPAGQAASAKMTIFGYAQTALHKVWQCNTGKWPNSVTTFDGYTLISTGGIRTTAAITSLQTVAFTGANALVAGSYIVLRGIP